MSDIARTHAAIRTSSASGMITVALCTLMATFEGFDLQAAGVAAPKLAPAFGLKPSELGWFFSASTFGLMLGAAIGGRLSDRFGRKITLILSIAIFGVLSIITGLSNDITGLVIARFFTGVGLGGALPNLIALVAEHTPVQRRSAAVGLLYAGMPCGGALSSLVSLIGSDPADWRIIFYVGGIAPLAALMFLIWLLPGSPGRVGRSLHAKVGIATAVFGERRALATGLLWVGFFFALLTMYLLLNWLPSLLIGRGLSRPNAALVQIAFNIFGALGSILTGLMMDHRHRRPAVVFTVFAATAIMLVAVAVAPVSLAISMCIGAGLGLTISGTQASIYGLAPSVYPTRVRGTGVGMGVAIGRLGSAAGPMLAAQLLGAGRSPTQVLLTMMPVMVVAGVATGVLAVRPPAED